MRRALARLRSDAATTAGHVAPIRTRAIATTTAIAARAARLAGRLSLAPRSDRSAARPARSGAHRASLPERLLRRADPTLVQGLLARLPQHVVRERAIPVAVACLVFVAALVSVAPATGAGGTGAVAGLGAAPRLAVGGADVAGVDTGGTGGTGSTNANLRILDGPNDSPSDQGPYLQDGTLLKPVAVDTTVADGSSKVTTYVVKSGDTLTGIADQFGISYKTIWWANHLSAVDELHIGQRLTIPLINGLVYTVKDGDTLASVASANGITTQAIVDANGLADATLIIGQVLVLPGAQGAPLPTATPTPTPKPVARSSGTYRPAAAPPATYRGGRFVWPVVGGGNYVSQYFWSGHQAIDIAAQYGSPVVAAAAGTVIWAGWRDNGGGYQVYVSHGSGLFTTYNHLSAITVGVGQRVGAGQQVGRIGMSGWATGPHLHFEVWIGTPWASGSYRVNPMNYL
ncbi:MAG TPA: M23 family metallopeptidase [Candidatus Limnocylindrales bacterium]